MSDYLADIGRALFILALLLLALEAGFRMGRSARQSSEGTSNPQLGVVQGAILGLLGLLLGFSFAGAAQRFVERQDLIVQEANAIGTAFLRANLLDEPHRTNLQRALADYVAHRIAVSRTLQNALTEDVVARVADSHSRIWNAALAGVRQRPETMLTILDPVNSVLDMHATRVSAARKHLPWPVQVLLLICSALSMSTIGYGCGLGGRRHIGITASLAVLIASCLWVTYDLDFPRSGIIRLNDQALTELDLRVTPASQP